MRPLDASTHDREMLFALGERAPADELIERLGARFSLHRLRPQERSCRWLDTPDWRLRRAGVELRGWGDGGVRELELRPKGPGPWVRQAVERSPEFAWELPAGRLREQLEPLTRVRRLLPQLESTTQVQGLEVLDRREKTVARVFLESGWARSPSAGEPRPLGPVVRVSGLRGYDEECRSLAGFLADDLGLVRLGQGELERGLEALGLDPDAQVPPWTVELRAGEPAGLALRRVLRRLLEIMERSEPGLLADVDSEFLHDFRVAVRRSRSILGQARAVLLPGVAERASAELSWLGRLTTWLRDLDVFVLQIREHVRQSDELWTALDPIRERLEQARAQELERVREGLASPRWAEFRVRWAGELRRPLTAEEPALARQPIAELAGERIARLHRRIRKSASRLEAEAPAEEFHALRLRCKKLRYLVDAFGGIYPAKGVRKLLRPLKRLQELLGEFNDLRVQRETLLRVASELEPAEPEVLLAMGRLIERLSARDAGLRSDILERLERFAAKRSRKRLARLLASASG